MPNSPVDYTTRDALAFVTLNRPERLNAITRQLCVGVEDAVAREHRRHLTGLLSVVPAVVAK
jgi:enoyl-CoA hydratase/carnithine racemase